MFEMTCIDNNGNPITHLTQWDVNQILSIDLDSINISSLINNNAPKVHFCNKKSEKAYVVESTIENNQLSAHIPNKLLTTPYTIMAYLYLEENDSKKTIYSILIPVVKRTQPSDYVYEDDIELIRIEDILDDVESIRTTITDKETELDELISTITSDEEDRNEIFEQKINEINSVVEEYVSCGTLCSLEQVGYVPIGGTRPNASATNAKSTKQIPLIKNSGNLYVKTSLSNAGAAITLLDIDEEIVTQIAGNGSLTEYNIDLSEQQYEDVAYVIASIYSSSMVSFDDFRMTIKYNEKSLLSEIEDLQSDIQSLDNDVSDLQEDVDNLEASAIHREDVFNIDGKLTEYGYVFVDTGNVSVTENGKHTDYIDIRGYDKLESFTWLNSSGAVFAFFDENKNYLSNLTVVGIGSDNTYVVDLTQQAYANAKYVIGSVYGPTKFDSYYLKATKNDNIESQIEVLEEEIGSIVKHYNTFSILGDSYSTFAGYMVDPNAATWYPASSHGMDDTNDVENVEQTWWYKFAQEYKCRLLENNSFSGSTISYDGYGQGTDDGKTTSFVERADLITTPELIIVFGGTNDVWVANDTGNTENFLGDYKYANWTESDLEKFRPALAYLFNKLKHKHIGAKIVFILNTNITLIESSVENICEYYNIDLLKLSSIEKAHSHPNSLGMTAITNQLISYLINN